LASSSRIIECSSASAKAEWARCRQRFVQESQARSLDRPAVLSFVANTPFRDGRARAAAAKSADSDLPELAEARSR